MKSLEATEYFDSIKEDIYRNAVNHDLMKVFEAHHNALINPLYEDRADRNRFAALQLTDGVKRILNLGGGGKRHLKQSIGSGGVDVFEVDLQGDCDLKVNLDEIVSLPFEDRSFDVACAFDVLEHLEKFHQINEEMFRVAKKYVLISLPNSASEVFYDAFWNRAQKEYDLERGVFSKFYGLPMVPPSDRHRWWLYFQDIVRFYYLFSLKNDARLEFWTPRLSLKKKIFKALFGAHLYYTFFCPVVWIKIERRD